MGLMSRWDRSNQQTMETHGEVARDGANITPAAKVILLVALGGTLLVMLICVIALVTRG